MITHRTHRLARIPTHFAAVVATASTLFAPPHTRAVTTTTWTSPTGGNFSDPANWSAGIPIVTLPALFATNPLSIPIVSLTADVPAGTLTVIHPDLTLDLAGHTLSVSDTLLVSAPAAASPANLTVSSSDPALPGTFAGFSSYVGNLAGEAGSLTITGPRTRVSGAAHVGAAANATGSLTLTDGATWNTNGNLYVGENGQGSLTISGGASASVEDLIAGRSSASASGAVSVTGIGSHLYVDDNFTIGGSGTGSLTIADGASVAARGLVIALTHPSSVTLTGANSSLTTTYGIGIGNSATTHAATGSLTLGPGSALSAEHVYISPNSLLQLDGGTPSIGSSGTSVSGSLTASVATTYPGSLNNQGLVNGPTTPGAYLNLTGSATGPGAYTGNVQFSSYLSPGYFSAASLSLQNALLSPTNTLSMKLAGTTPGSEYDHLSFTGLPTLGGTLFVFTLNSFQPTLGQSFDLFDFNGSTPVGTFSTLLLPPVAKPLRWDTSSLYTTGTITLIPEPTAAFALILPLLFLLRLPVPRRRQSKQNTNFSFDAPLPPP